MRKQRYKEKRPLGAMADRKSESVPSFTRIMSKHGLCAADAHVAVAYDIFTRVSADPVVQALKPRAVIPRTNVLGIYAATAAALERMNTAQKQALLERLTSHFRLYQYR